MRLVEIGVGSWFRCTRWSENAVAYLDAAGICEDGVTYGWARIKVYGRNPAHGVPSMRSRNASVKELGADDWAPCVRPEWIDSSQVASAAAVTAG